MGNELTDGAEVLFRHIHPNFMEDGEPSSDRFRPSEKDENLLSVDRSALVTAADAHAFYVGNGRAAVAVFGISVAEFNSEDISCSEDPTPATDTKKANPAHALANYAKHSAKSQKNIAKKLKRLALERGQLHPATAEK